MEEPNAGEKEKKKTLYDNWYESIDHTRHENIIRGALKLAAEEQSHSKKEGENELHEQCLTLMALRLYTQTKNKLKSFSHLDLSQAQDDVASKDFQDLLNKSSLLAVATLVGKIGPDQTDSVYKNLPNLFDEITLKSLNLSGHELSSLPDEFCQLTNLTELDLSHNQFTEIPASLYKLTNLISLNVSDNFLHELPEEITQIINLKKLDRGLNEFSDEEVPESIKKMKYLNIQ